MKTFVINVMEKDPAEETVITADDFNQFLRAKGYGEQLKLLILHSQKNKQTIETRRNYQMENTVKTQAEIEKEMLELNEQFSAFLHTKGIAAKFKLAFGNMGESAAAQKAADKANFEAVKTQSAEDNKEFVEFLHTKGVKAKFHVVTENIKAGAKAAPANTAAQIAKVKTQTQANIAAAQASVYTNPYIHNPYASAGLTAEELSREFNEFLKSKGLDEQYTVNVTEA